MRQVPGNDKKNKSIHTTSKIALIILLLHIVAQVVTIYQTKHQLVSGLFSESQSERIIWSINKPYFYQAILSAIIGVAAFALYFYKKYRLVIIFVALALLCSHFILLALS